MGEESKSRAGDSVEKPAENVDELQPKAPWPVRAARFGLKWLSVGYFFALIAALAGMEWGNHWFLSALSFLPPYGWLLPLVVLIPLSLFIRPGLLWMHAGAILLVFFGFMHWRTPSSPPQGEGLTLLSNNTCDRKVQTLWPFVAATKPDVVALQNVGSMAPQINSRFRDRFVARHGEFFLASRFPIRNSGLVRGLEFEGQPVAAWFEVQYNGRSVVVYNVHMPTPRYYLLMLRGRNFGQSLQGHGGVWSGSVRAEFASYWAQRLELTEKLIGILEREKRPFILAGDFNMPDHGYLYRQYKSRFTDGFAAEGRGYGLTFPASGGSIEDFLGPWLRIDYLFGDARWRVVSCEVEPRTDAEHLAVCGKFELGKGK